jgi:dephospho-CoA kinase
MKVIGLIGRIASGKSSIADYMVDEKEAAYFRFSDVLRDVLARIHEQNTRENLQKLGISLRSAFGDDILAKSLRADVLEDNSEYVIIDGIRYQDEVEMVKSLGGVTVYVHSPVKTRYERVLSRGSRGEARISLKEFNDSEEKPTEKRIDEIGQNADFIIENTGTMDELKDKVDRIIERI